jgi:hypothetical protein
MPKNRLNHSLEQVCDGMINLIIKNAGARTLLTADALVGATTLAVESTVHFQDSEQIVLIDINDGHVEYHSILSLDGINSLRVVQPLESNFLVGDTATMQKAIGNVSLAENAVLFGDREVIPNPELTITVDPTTMNSMEWMYLRGGLSMQHNLIITVYAKLDTHDNAIRVVQKYGDYLFDLIMNNLHLDIVNDEVFVTQDVAEGSNVVHVPSIEGWNIDPSLRYELQDNNHANIDFSVVDVRSGPPRIILDRPTNVEFKVSEKAIFRRRVRYIWNALVSEVEYGFIQKNSQMYKACKLNWWGKEVNEVMFPQVTTGGIM